MKRIYLLLIAAIALINTANAQRNVNLEVTLVDPAANSVIQPGQSFNKKAIVKNVGSTPLKATDTILYRWQFGQSYISFGTPPNTVTVLGITGRTLNQNDTIQITGTWGINYTASTDSVVDFCLAVNVLNSSADSARDLTQTNNNSCKSVTRKAGSATGIENGSITAFEISNTVTVYPNPVQSIANFIINTNDIADVTIRIMDLTGRTIISEHKGQLTGNKTVSINTDILKTGMYLYQVQIGNDLKSGKLLIAK